MTKKITPYKQSLHSDEVMVIVEPTNFDPKSQQVLISLDNKVTEGTYNAVTKNIVAKIMAPISNTNQATTPLRFKVFLYDFQKNKILEGKLQEFIYYPLTLDYNAIDKIVCTSPVILGWKKPKKEVEKPRQIEKIEVNHGKSIDGLKKEFNVDVFLNDLSPGNFKLNQTVEVIIGDVKTIANYYPPKSNKVNQLFAKVGVTFQTIVLESQTYNLTARIMDNPFLGTPMAISSKTIKVLVMGDGSVSEVVDEVEATNNLLDKKYFYKQYQTLFGSLTKQNVTNIELIIDSISEYYQSENRICNSNQLAYMLATVKHETADTYKPINEYGGKKYYEEMYDPILGKNAKRKKMAMDNGNTSQGDGVKYHGRGFVQLTWKDNYNRMGDKFNVDLVNNPELALDPKLALKILVYGSESGTFTGLKLEDFINSNDKDYYNARKVINGLDKAKKIENYAINLEKCIKLY